MMRNKIYGFLMVILAIAVFFLGVFACLRYRLLSAALASLVIFSICSVIFWIGLVFITAGVKKDE